MPIRSIAQLKAWFRRGKYPTEEQFADWLDSYVHKEESKIPIAQVEELPEQLNGKYAATAGQELERQHRELKRDYDAHKRSSAEQFDNIAENIEELEATDERQQEEIDALEVEVENIHKKDAEQDKEITALHKTDSDQQAEIDTANANLEHLRKCLHPTAIFGSLESTFSALGANYSTFWALANTLKTFLETNDTADATINRWQEIEHFLQGITDSDSLTALLSALEENITKNYQLAISQATENTLMQSKNYTDEKIGEIGQMLDDINGEDV